jgi:long-chain fatty acid transport protein
VGRYQAYQSSINGIAFSPSLAYRIGNKLSVGGGVSALYTLFNEKIAVNQGPAADGEVDQVPQGARFKGEFDRNWMFIIGANLQYRF